MKLEQTCIHKDKTCCFRKGYNAKKKKKVNAPRNVTKKTLSRKNTGFDCIFPKLCVGAYCGKCEDNVYVL